MLGSYLRSANIDFIKMRWITFSIFLSIFVITFVSFFANGLRYGVDFHGGYLFEMSAPVEGKSISEDDVRNELSLLGIDEFFVYTDVNKKISFRISSSCSKELIMKIKNDLPEKFGVTFEKFESIGPKLSKNLIYNGICAIAFAICGIFLYICFRYKWNFGLAAVITLINDLVILFSIFAVFKMEFNENAIVAFLVTISYAINDVVVIFDRIQDNIKLYSKMDIKDLVNMSLNTTLYRTVMTSMTTLISLLVLYAFGGNMIQGFSLPIMIGIFGGTISSIFLAGPLSILFYNKNSK